MAQAALGRGNECFLNESSSNTSGAQELKSAPPLGRNDLREGSRAIQQTLA